MKCRNCNAELPDELHFTFCGYCGERLVRERKKKNEIKIPTPRKRGQRWYVDLRREGVTVIEDTEAEAKAKAIAIRAGFIDAKKKQPALTLRAAIDNYIGDRDNALSPATVRGYITIKNNAFAPVMDTDIFSVRNWQSVVNVEAGRGISAKTLQNEWGLVKSVKITTKRRRHYEHFIAAQQCTDVRHMRRHYRIRSRCVRRVYGSRLPLRTCHGHRPR